ncbi:uncharacterized protein LOC135812311 [Sycon ciliatum]|uniref:uncharacterized protein LOC135812311 n=1 Tax=Sycon ciliatum TaxID=27933 RepID=UPI0031F7208B
MRKRSGSHTPPRMGREASPFFNVLLVFSVVVSVLATFTIGLGAKVELQLGNSHTQWSASLWWGAIVILCLALFYLLVHMSIQKGWQVSRYSFMLYQVLCLIALAVTIAAIDRSYATYKNVLSVQTDQCVFVNQEGTYVPATSCYDPCREYLNRTLGHANPPSVCCCCSISLRDDNEDNFIYFTRVKDCSDVDASESELRYLTICYMVMLVMQFMELLFCLVVQFSCCGVIAPWRYMLLNASGRYSIN